MASLNKEYISKKNSIPIMGNKNEIKNKFPFSVKEGKNLIITFGKPNDENVDKTIEYATII
jgi:hypothetical protein